MPSAMDAVTLYLYRSLCKKKIYIYIQLHRRDIVKGGQSYGNWRNLEKRLIDVRDHTIFLNYTNEGEQLSRYYKKGFSGPNPSHWMVKKNLPMVAGRIFGDTSSMTTVNCKKNCENFFPAEDISILRAHCA